ncbi:MAG: hypothetical protein HC893_11630 [Chloroflexaceae bacterium]|nr:hypothetical protein [Chloroflexaceae bacterium]
MEYTNGLHQNLIQTNTDLQETVRLAQLRYVSDDEPGIRREGSGDEVRYIDPQGKRITDKAVLKRIAEIGVPPGYTDVWICTDANGHRGDFNPSRRAFCQIPSEVWNDSFH